VFPVVPEHEEEGENDEDKENAHADFKLDGAFEDFSHTEKMYSTDSPLGLDMGDESDLNLAASNGAAQAGSESLGARN